MYHFAAIPKLSLMHLVEGALLGMTGALIAVIFVFLFRTIGRLSEYIAHHTIVLATLGGLSIDRLLFPQTLFWRKEIETIVETGATFGIRCY